MKKRPLLLLLVSCLSLALAVRTALSCTLFTVLGEKVQGGGAVLAKTRDMPPNHTQELRLEAPVGAFKYVGLFAVDGSRPGLKDGVNEKGLVILSSAASCLPQTVRSRFPGPPDLLAQILGSCDSVDAVLKKPDGFTHPAFYLVVDRTKAALIEVGLESQRQVREVAKGALTHTNHYLHADLQLCNWLNNLSSLVRLSRIDYLLKRHSRPLTLEDAIGFTEDRHDGPDHSIWRQGSTKSKVRTLATWVAALPLKEPVRLQVKLANPNAPIQVQRWTLDEPFWQTTPGRLLPPSPTVPPSS